MYGGVAQLVRATACHAVGRRFESGRPRQIKNPALVVGFWFFGMPGRERGRGSGKREFHRWRRAGRTSAENGGVLRAKLFDCPVVPAKDLEAFHSLFFVYG